jgi:hypothetical protein
MNSSSFVLRSVTLATFALASTAFGPVPANAAGDIYVHAGANFKPVTVAVTPFAGEEGADKIGGIVNNEIGRAHV